MLPEVQVLIERAATRRFALEGLLDAIPGDYWGRAATGDAWSVRRHVEHLATIEDLVEETVGLILGGQREAWAANASTTHELVRRRDQMMASASAVTRGELREMMGRSRARLTSRFEGVQPGHLEATVFVAGIVDAWREPVRFSLREYLRSWPEHDQEHEAAIRRALETPPDLSAAALVRRVQPGRRPA